ncbi:peptidase S8 [Flavobacterium cyanobacteriorum]|uniref:Peptidase S8 n=1 Tax=Flavobacterium cyanobacteriorum TaxID=2022802 RepID=A0A255ZRT0_9FLAO|nr:S8 family serine peptidase [Flavobacterium cyanobacteriorum]OYQ43634.1 peptidase S8 [Flavobacterium cyanobacteriorum]
MRLICIYLLLLCGNIFAQQDAWVYFTDKPQAEFYLNNPLEMLSQRALNRRAAQGIALDAKDVPIHQPYIDQVTASPGITVMAQSKWMNALHIRGTVADINALLALPFVEAVDFADNSLNSRTAQAQQQQAVTKNLDVSATFSYGTSANQVQMLNGQVLHQQDYTGTGKIIAVMDAGFPGVNTTQPFQRLQNNNLILGGYNFVQRSPEFYTGHYHGTYVLSAMAGFVEGQLVGTAPDAGYYLFITENSASENPVEESLWVEAAEMADSLGVDIINTSLGYFGYDNPNYSYTNADLNGNTAFITRGANIAFTRGIVLVNSGGNSGNTANPYITPPADAYNILAVGAVNATEVISPFSSIGPTADGRIKPDVVAQGVGSVVADTNGSIITASGTSISAPIVAGLIACLWQALPGKTNSEILQIVKQSADRYTNPDMQYGYGVPDFAQALQSATVTEQPEPGRVHIYPNPVTDTLIIALPQNTVNATIILFNTLGQLVLQQPLAGSQASVATEGIATGIYTYRIEAGGILKTGKLVKQ